MGVPELREVIKRHAPNAIQKTSIENYSGQKIAIDVLIDFIPSVKALRKEKIEANEEEIRKNNNSHLKNLFDLTVRLIRSNIKPVYVFDGEPPELKRGREDQICEQTKTYAKEAKELLNLMGIPFVEAKSEAEAQCSDMLRCNKVDCVATIDMDAIPFKTDRVLRFLTKFNKDLEEIVYDKVLEGLNFNHDQLVDMCILMGCSYCESIFNVGPVKAFNLIKKYESIENFIENIGETNFRVPENWQYVEARELLNNPEVYDSQNLNLIWQDPNGEGLTYFFARKEININPRDIEILQQALR